MEASIVQSRRDLPVWLSVMVWLAAFFSPTGYFILLILANRFLVPAPPELVMSMFVLIPVVALIYCGTVVWRSSETVAHRTVWLLCTVVAMSLQCGIILAIILVAIQAAIGYAQ